MSRHNKLCIPTNLFFIPFPVIVCYSILYSITCSILFLAPFHSMLYSWPPCELPFLVLQQQQNLGRRFGTSKMHLSPPVAKAAIRSKAVVLLLLTFCLLLLPLWKSVIVLCFVVRYFIAIILMGKRELIALLNLSSWCLVMVKRLFLAVPWGCLQFVIVVFPDHTHLLFLVTTY